MTEKDLAIVAMDNDEAVDDEAADGEGADEAAGETTGRGTMVIRIWSGEGDEGGFRARLTFSRTVKDQPHVRVARSRDAILQTVHEWLEEFDG